MIDISVVVANFNNPELISTCLQTIDKYLLRPGLEVVIVDNGSVSQELETLRLNRPHVVIKYLPINMGFGYAINRGAELARGSNLLILNSDVEIIDFSLQSLMLEFRDEGLMPTWMKLRCRCIRERDHPTA